jgi:uncharacterized membrane protein
MICSYCSAEMPDISVFCPGCGRSVQQAREDLRPPISPSSSRDSVLAVFAYFAMLPAILLLVIPPLRSSGFVRFHSWQSIFFTIATAIAALLTRLLFFVFSALPVIGFLLAWLCIGLVAMAVVVLWGVLVVKAGLGEAFELPWIGRFAEQLAAKEDFH